MQRKPAVEIERAVGAARFAGAERGAQLTNWNYYASPNSASTEFIDQEVLDDPIVYPPDTSILELIRDTGDFETNYSDAFIEAKG